ncbi:ABC transporter substrate-binding protein, partial [Clostridium sp.]|uniref:ABC transporter substrate-binding protein n=1 Tax=Clostridium sp. TaxID=1506 RepID=UPI00260FDF5D
MIKKIIATLLIGTSILVVSCDRSNKVEESELQEKKIVSATVSATQVMDKMEIDLVGVPTTKTNLPKRYEGVIDVGQSFAPNFETIASLTPDLLIIDINFKDKVKEQVKQYEMNTYYFDTTSFTNFKASIIELGELLDKKDESGKVVDELGKSVEDVLKKGKKSNKKPKIAIVFGSAESYMLATDISYIGDLLNTIDVDNVTDS